MDGLVIFFFPAGENLRQYDSFSVNPPSVERLVGYCLKLNSEPAAVAEEAAPKRTEVNKNG